MIFDRLRRAFAPGTLPFDMFDHVHTDTEARRARRMESIYHVGQHKIWDGREVLADLVKKHGRPDLDPKTRRALARIFSIIMWGELAAWKISAQLAEEIVPLEGKLAAASQVHDEARHFYVMHDYLETIGEKPMKLDFWARRIVEMTLSTPNLAKKLLGMQLTLEVIALTIFQQVREMDVEPVLSELMPYYERDEARHVGLGVQMLPALMAKMSIPEHVDLALFQLEMIVSTLFSLKSMEPDLLSIGVDPREILVTGFRKQNEVNEQVRKEYPAWPEDSAVRRVFDGVCELMFPLEEKGESLSTPQRIARAVEVLRRARPSVQEIYAKKTTAHAKAA